MGIAITLGLVRALRNRAGRARRLPENRGDMTMADERTDLSVPKIDGRPADRRRRCSGNDPLAELARLIGQTDPFSEFGANRAGTPCATNAGAIRATSSVICRARSAQPAGQQNYGAKYPARFLIFPSRRCSPRCLIGGAAVRSRIRCLQQRI